MIIRKTYNTGNGGNIVDQELGEVKSIQHLWKFIELIEASGYSIEGDKITYASKNITITYEPIPEEKA